VQRPQKEILQAIYPNAVKIGFTSLGGFLVNKSSIFIGSLYLSLTDLASYGISIQLILVLSSLAGIYITTYQPKIAMFRVEKNNLAIKDLYIKSQIMLIVTFFIGGFLLVLYGNWALHLIGSKTTLLSPMILLALLIITFLEVNHSTAATVLLTKNEVPFLNAYCGV